MGRDIERNTAGGAPRERPGGGADGGRERLRAAFEEAAVGMALKDMEGRLLETNSTLRGMLGYGEEELRGMLRSDFTHPEDAAEDAELYGRLLAGEIQSFRQEKRYVRKDGSTMWGRLSVSRVGSVDGGPAFAVGVVEDIDELKRAEEALRISERRFRAVIDQSPLSIHVFAADGISLRANASWNELWNLEEGESAEGKNVFEDEQLQATGLIPLVKEGVAGLQAVSPPLLYDPARHGREGDPRWLRAVVYPIRDDDGRVSEVALIIEDVTERKALEDKLAHQAFHDHLTGLPNRALFMDRLGQALARAGRRGERVAVLFMDLDNFKYVNDSLGHEAGDALLVEVAERLKGSIRPGDTAARLGGDEFCVLLEDVEDEGQAVRVAERVAEGLEAPIPVDGREVFAVFSIGIAAGESDAADVLRNADAAMYEAKRRGKARYAVYEEGMSRKAHARLELENDLRRAVEREEFEVHYQPKISLSSGRVAGFEALARWRHPRKGVVPPASFIPLAEETGLIVAIGRQVLRRACEQARRWRDRWEGDGSPPTVWANLSARQLHEPDLAGWVSSALREAGLEPEGLGLEITESVLMEDGSASIGLLEELRALGVKLAVDDFGTGYSSLSYLKRLPVDFLKIDRSFVDGLGKDAGDTMIVSAVVSLARAMKLGVVAEGVETAGQLARLEEMGCDLAQGYYFAKPLPSSEASELLDEGRQDTRGDLGARR